MGRKTEALLRGFRAAKCLTHLKLVSTRIKVIKNKRSASAKQMRGEIAQLLKSGQDSHVYITKADALIKQENMVAVYDLIDEYCRAIIGRFPAIEMQRDCPIDMKEPIASIIFAAPRCVELTELATVKEAFVAKYGKDFAAAAAELRPDCGVNKRIIELLSTRPASGQMKVKIMKEICVEHKVQWTPPETLVEPSTNTPVGSSQQHVGEAVKVAGDVGSNKAKLVEAGSVKVDEAGPSKIGTQTPLPGGPKHAGSTKVGLAAAESLKTGDGAVFISGASKTSDTKLFSKENVGKTNASVFQSVKAAMIQGTSSGKFGVASGTSEKTGGGAVLAKESSKVHDTTHSSFADEDVERLNARIFQSLKGSMDTGTSIGFDGDVEAKADADVHVEPVVDAQDGVSDSDSDSFVSVEEGRLEDDIEPSSVEALVSGKLEGDVEASSVGAVSKSERFEKTPLQADEEADVNRPSLSKKPSREVRESSSSYTESSQKDVFSRASSKNSSVAMESSLEDTFHRASSNNSLNTEALPDEKSFRRESRKSSLREKELAQGQSFRVMETVVADDSLKLAEGQSFTDKILMEKVAEEASSEAIVEEGLQRKDEEVHDEGNLPNKGIVEDTSVVETAESLAMEQLVEEYPLAASQNKMTTEYTSSLPASDMQKMQSFSDRIPAKEISSGAGALATSDYSNDFAAAAKAIAAEAARLAVLDYAKRMAGSSSIPIDFTKFGIAFEETPTEGPQVGRILSTEGKSVWADTQDAQYEGDSMNARKDIVQEENLSKVEISAYADKGDKGDHVDIDEMGYMRDAARENSLNSKTPGAVEEEGHVNDANMGNTGTKDELKPPPEMTSGNDDINPFATGIVTKVDNDTHPLFLNTGDHESLSSAKPGLMSKGGGFGQEDDHLDVFFRRKTAWLHEERPMFDEDRYSFGNVKSSFIEDKVPYQGFGKKESSFQDSFVSTPVFDNVSAPVFDNVPERQSTFSEETSSSFKSPVFDDGPEPYDASFSFNDGLDETSLSVGLSDKQGPQSPPNIKAPLSFDVEPEPRFDKVVDEEEQFSMEKKESTQMGHLKWQSKKTDAKVGSSTSDTSLGGTSNPMSRRSRRQPHRIDDYEYDSEMLAEGKSAVEEGNSSRLASKRPIGSSSSLMQPQQKEQGRKDTDNVAEKGNVRTKPVESFAYNIDAMSKRPSSISPKRVSRQQDHGPSDESELDGWDSTSTIVGGRFPSGRTTKSPTRLAQRQEVALEESDEEYYFAEGKSQVGSGSAGSSVSGRTTKSPARVAKQQLFAQGYDEDQDDAEGYIMSTKPSRQSKVFEQEDDSIEEIQARYKPPTQTNDLGKRTSGTYSQQQQQPHRRREEYNSESGYKQYGQINDAVGRSNPSSRLSARQKRQDLEEEQDLSTLHTPFAQVDDLVKRPLSSRQQQKKPIEEEGPALASKYKPQVDDLGRASSSPHWQRQQRRQEEFMIQEHEQEQEEEELYSMPLPDWRQEQRRKEKQYIAMPLYGHRQDSNLEKTSSDLYMEEDEQQEEELGPPLNGHEKLRRPVPTYGRREELKIEKENPGAWQQEQEQQRPISGRRQQKNLAEEEVENWQQRPISGRRQQKTLAGEEAENWQQQPISGRRQQKILAEEEADNWQQRPISGRRQQKILAEEEAENWQQRPISGRRQQKILAVEEAENWQQRPISVRRQQKILAEEEAENGQQRPISGHQQQQGLVEEETENWQQQAVSGRRQQKSLAEEEMEIWQQQPVSGRRQQKSLAEEEDEIWQRRPIWQQQSLVEEETKSWQQRPISDRRQEFLAEEEDEIRQRRPLSGRRQQQSLAEEEAENGQQRPISGRRQEKRLAEKEAENGQQQPISGRRQQQGLVKEEEDNWPQQRSREKQRPPSPLHKKSLEVSLEPIELQQEVQPYQSTTLPEEHQKQVESVTEDRPSPLYNSKPELKFNKESSPVDGGKLDLNKEQPQSQTKEEGVKEQKEKPGVKSQPPARRPPSLPTHPASSPLETSVSDPIILATIPPPVKKTVVPPAPAETKLESSVSTPPPSSVPEVKAAKLPQKSPNVDDLLANFEAFRKARKGE